MPWKRAKALPPPDNSLFEACFRLQREASEAAGRFISMVVENVKGAQPWVGRAKAHFGSFFLWGNIEMYGNKILIPGKWDSFLRAPGRLTKFNPDGSAHPQGSWFKVSNSKDRGAQTKNDGGSWFAEAHNTTSGKGQNPVTGTKTVGCVNSRKAASAQIAKIPEPLSRWIAMVYKKHLDTQMVSRAYSQPQHVVTSGDA